MNYENDKTEFERVKNYLVAAVKAGLQEHELSRFFIGTDANSFLNTLTGQQHPYQNQVSFGVQIHQFLANPKLLEQHLSAVAKSKSVPPIRTQPLKIEPVETDSKGKPSDLFVEEKKK